MTSDLDALMGSVEELRTRWQTDGPEAVLPAAEAFCEENPAAAEGLLLFGCVLKALDRIPAASERLMAAARDPAVRSEALVALASCADGHQMPEVLSLFVSLPPSSFQDERLRYAYGLSLWRYGEEGEALAVWADLSARAKARMGDHLDNALIAHAERLRADDMLAEAIEVLRSLSATDGGRVRRVARLTAIAALRSGMSRVAAQAIHLLANSDDPIDRALCAYNEPSGRARADALAEVVAQANTPDLAGWAARTAAAEAALQGDWDTALKVLGPDSPNQKAQILRAFLFAAMSRDSEAVTFTGDWRLLKKAAEGVPGLVEHVLPLPEPCAPEAEAAYWLSCGEHGRAYALLAEVQRSNPEELGLARHLAVIAYIQAMRAAPEVNEAAWTDCVAQMSYVLASEDWLSAWILERLAVYDLRENEKECTEELRIWLERRLDGNLSRLEAVAREADNPGNAEAARRIRLAFARERKAAEAMRKQGGLTSESGGCLAFGPLLAEKTGLRERLSEYFATDALTTDEDQMRRERLGRLLQELRLGDDALSRLLTDGEGEGRAAVRRWFSELGEAASRYEAGDVGAARELALEVYARWSPPGTPDQAVFRSKNPAYAHLDDGVEKLRGDAARMFCEMAAKQFEQRIAHADLDARPVTRNLRWIIRQASAFGMGPEIQFELTRSVLGRCQAWLEDGTPDALHQACDLMRQAAEAGLEQLEHSRSNALVSCANRLMEEGRWRQAVARCEEAWECNKEEPRLPTYLVACLLRWREALQEDHRSKEAAEALRKARDVGQEAGRIFGSHEDVQLLPRLVQLAEDGHPTSEMLNLPGKDAEEAPTASEMPEDAIQAVRDCHAARHEGDLDAALAAAERARQAAPNHPDAVALAAHMALELARTLPQDQAIELFEAVGEHLQPQRLRYGTHARLQAAGAVFDRDRILYSGEGHVATLHRKGLRLFLEKRYPEAAELLSIAFALAPRQEPEVIALLSETLIDEAGDLAGRDREGARNRLTRAERLLAIGRETAPEHPGMSRVRVRLAEMSNVV